MRVFGVAVLMGLAVAAIAGPVDVFKSGVNAEFDLNSGTYTSNFGSGTIGMQPPSLATKPANSLNITVDAGAFFGTGQSIPVTMTGAELSPTRVQWSVNQAMNVTVTINGTRLTVQHVTGLLTADAQYIAPFMDVIAGRMYNVSFLDATGDAGNTFTVTGVLPDFFNAPFNATAQSLNYNGFGGTNRWEPIPGMPSHLG